MKFRFKSKILENLELTKVRKWRIRAHQASTPIRSCSNQLLSNTTNQTTMRPKRTSALKSLLIKSARIVSHLALPMSVRTTLENWPFHPTESVAQLTSFYQASKSKCALAWFVILL